MNGTCQVCGHQGPLRKAGVASKLVCEDMKACFEHWLALQPARVKRGLR